MRIPNLRIPVNLRILKQSLSEESLFKIMVPATPISVAPIDIALI